MFWCSQNICAARYGDYKALQKFGTDDWSLYNVAEDRNELNNLAAAKPELLAKMVNKWYEWAWRARVLPKGEERK